VLGNSSLSRQHQQARQARLAGRGTAPWSGLPTHHGAFLHRQV